MGKAPHFQNSPIIIRVPYYVFSETRISAGGAWSPCIRAWLFLCIYLSIHVRPVYRIQRREGAKAQFSTTRREAGADGVCPAGRRVLPSGDAGGGLGEASSEQDGPQLHGHRTSLAPPSLPHLTPFPLPHPATLLPPAPSFFFFLPLLAFQTPSSPVNFANSFFVLIVLGFREP